MKTVRFSLVFSTVTALVHSFSTLNSQKSHVLKSFRDNGHLGNMSPPSVSFFLSLVASPLLCYTFAGSFNTMARFSFYNTTECLSNLFQ
jgi:hypothetical protein